MTQFPTNHPMGNDRQPIHDDNHALSIFDDITKCLTFFKSCGARQIDISDQSLQLINDWAKPIFLRSKKNKLQNKDLSDIQQRALSCTNCNLSANRKNVVFGEGSPHGRLMFIADTPNQEEDAFGQPFVGVEGDLFNRIIQSIRQTRNSVYLTHIIKCVTPNGHAPSADEIQACFQWLMLQIESIQPEYICTLGELASQIMIQSSDPIDRLRGRFYSFQGIQVLPTYHPALLLRHKEKKRDVWEDLKLLMKTMDI